MFFWNCGTLTRTPQAPPGRAGVLEMLLFFLELFHPRPHSHGLLFMGVRGAGQKVFFLLEVF
jgi:hypothetical protein